MSEHASHDHAHEEHLSPIRRLLQNVAQDRGDLIALFIYTVVTGLLALVVPVATQSLVNTIAQRIFVQNLVVLTAMVLFFTLFTAVLRLMQLSLVELLQQRIFARTAIQLAGHLPRIKNNSIQGEYAPELVNRFFDVLTIQKTTAKLLLDGLAAFLQTCVGLVLLAFYSPLLLGFDIFILVFIGFVFFVLGYRGLHTSIQESIQKYKVAGWLEELARCHISLKMDGSVSMAVERADNLVTGYVKARREHFRVTFRQAFGNYFFQAIATTATLGAGGWLVIQGDLTLGQLVASELIILSVVSALDKLISQSEQFYDLLTGLDKVGHLTDMPTERTGGQIMPTDSAGVRVLCRGVRFSYVPGSEVLSDMNFSLSAGDRVSLVGASGAGKSTLAALLCGLEEPHFGTIELNGIDVRQVDLQSLRNVVALVGDINEIVEGTVEENIRFGRTAPTSEDIRWAIEVAQLTEDIARMPLGINTPIVSAGRNISRGQMQRLLIARALVERPQLLILDEAFTGIDERTKIKILDAIYAPQNHWTIIDISHDAEVVLRSGTVQVLSDGKIVETSTPANLAQQPNSAFAQLFPDLCAQITASNRTRRGKSEPKGGVE